MITPRVRPVLRTNGQECRETAHRQLSAFLATELARHGTLQDRLAAAGERGLDLDEVIRWTRHACFGVARAHDLRLLHNDLKPGNLFLNAEEECLVGDFGCATLIPAGMATVQPHGATPETTAPEIAASWGTRAASASILSDVYSLGATAVCLLAARPPHDLTGMPDVASKMAIVATQPAAVLRDLAPHVPKAVVTAIDTAIKRSPGDRYQTVTDFAAALGRRPAAARRWRRTDEHLGHLACWRGEPRGAGSTYVLCLERGSRPSQCTITTVHAGSGRRVSLGCRSAYLRSWGQAVRSVIQKLGQRGQSQPTTAVAACVTDGCHCRTSRGEQRRHPRKSRRIRSWMALWSCRVTHGSAGGLSASACLAVGILASLAPPARRCGSGRQPPVSGDSQGCHAGIPARGPSSSAPISATCRSSARRSTGDCLSDASPAGPS
jgi:eukaryotic-like serine/threonine-protein kinase